MPRDSQGRMSPKLPILCQVTKKTLTQSVSQPTDFRQVTA